MPDTVGDTLAPPADATIDGRDASGDGPRDARGDGGIGDEEPDCSCALGSRPTRPGGEALLAVMAFALIGGRRSLRRRRGRTGVEPNRRKPSAH
jgi:MYXO-CTERM domain-containing protein